MFALKNIPPLNFIVWRSYHIRQANKELAMEELETSEGLIEAIYVSMKQTIKWKQLWSNLSLLKSCWKIIYILPLLRLLLLFIHSHGKLATQDLDIYTNLLILIRKDLFLILTSVGSVLII